MLCLFLESLWLCWVCSVRHPFSPWSTSPRCAIYFWEVFFLLFLLSLSSIFHIHSHDLLSSISCRYTTDFLTIQSLDLLLTLLPDGFPIESRMGDINQLRLICHGKSGYLIYRTERECGCPVCNCWTDSEKNVIKKEDNITFGYFEVTGSTDVQIPRTINICSKQIIRMKLVARSPFYLDNIRVKDLDWKVAGDDKTTHWKYEVYVDSELCRLSMKVYSHIIHEPKQDVDWSPVKLRITFQGSRECYLIIKSTCRCEMCVKWLPKKQTAFAMTKTNGSSVPSPSKIIVQRLRRRVFAGSRR